MTSTDVDPTFEREFVSHAGCSATRSTTNSGVCPPDTRAGARGVPSGVTAPEAALQRRQSTTATPASTLTDVPYEMLRKPSTLQRPAGWVPPHVIFGARLWTLPPMIR